MDTRRDPCYTGNDALINHQLGWQLVISLYPGTPYDYSATARGHVSTPGACSLDREGRVVAPGDHELQAVRAVQNLLAALAAHAIGPESVVKNTVFVVAQVRADLVRVWESSWHVSDERRASSLASRFWATPTSSSRSRQLRSSKRTLSPVDGLAVCVRCESVAALVVLKMARVGESSGPCREPGSGPSSCTRSLLAVY